MIKPGKVGFTYTDASRIQFDNENEAVLQQHYYPEVIFFGDSLTWYMPLKGEVFSETWINRGIPGDCAFFMPHRFSADVIQLKPQKVIIWCGVNDIINCLMNEAPYEEIVIEDCQEIVFRKIEIMAMEAKQKQIRVYIASILPIENPMGKTLNNTLANQVILELNKKINYFCEANNFEYIDYYPILVDEETGFLPQALTVDGVHLKKQGYKALFPILFETIKK